MKYTVWNETSYKSPRSIKVKVVQNYGQGSPMVPKESVLTITQNPGNVRQGSTTLYQWGRKDAFPGEKGERIDISSSNFKQLQYFTIIKPRTFFINGSGWSDTPPDGYTYYNLWSANNTAYGFNDNPVVKTVYDPCPAGFKMPASNAFTGFTLAGNNSSPKNVTGAWNNGWNFNNRIANPDATVYFPASSYREDDGFFVEGEHSGNYWSAIPDGDNLGSQMTFDQIGMIPLGNNIRAFGYSVRPVADN